jgi:transposase
LDFFDYMEAATMAWKLSNKEWDAVDNLRFSTTEAAVFRNATIILMSAAGCSKPAIAHDLGCSVGTVDNIRKAYRLRGLPGLIPGKPSGRPSRATPEYRAALRAAVQTPPQELGYGFSVWSLPRLCAHLEKRTGIRFSDDQLGRIMRQEKFSYQRPKHTMKGKRDEVAYQQAAGKLRTLKKKRSAMMLTKH